MVVWACLCVGGASENFLLKTRYINSLFDWLIDWYTIGFRQQLSTTSFEACELEITVNYFFCIHLNREWQFHAKSNELIGAFLACLPDWAQGPSLLRDKCGLPLPGCGTIVPVLWLLFSWLLMLPTFQPLSSNSLKSLRVPYCFDRYEIFNQNWIFL